MLSCVIVPTWFDSCEKWRLSRIVQKHTRFLSYYSLLAGAVRDESEPDSRLPYMAQHARRHVSTMDPRPSLHIAPFRHPRSTVQIAVSADHQFNSSTAA